MSDDVLPPLTPIEGLEHLGDPLDLLSEVERQQLNDDLAEMARVRRRAEVNARGRAMP
jgi:hypothetical protein